MTQTLMVKLSPALKDAVGVAASAANQNMSEFVRACVAQAIGYDLRGDAALDGRGRPRTYKTESERKAARRRQEHERQSTRNKVVTELMHRERLEDIAALERWLTARGISLTDEQTAQSA